MKKMKEIFRRGLSFSVALGLAFSSVQLPVSASDPPAVESSEFTEDTVSKVTGHIETQKKMKEFQETEHPSDMEEFDSTRLVVLTDDADVIVDKTDIVGQYDDLYLLQYDTVDEAMDAYTYYKDKAEAVEPDTEISAAENPVGGGTGEPIDESTISNPLEALEQTEDLPEVQEEHGVIALIDTGTSEHANVIDRVSVIDEKLEGGDHGNAMLDTIVSQDPEAKVLSIRALDDKGFGSVASIVSAMEYAIAQDVDMINLSLYARTTLTTSVLKEYILRADAAGIIVVGAAGNDGADVKDYVPGSVEEAYIIGAADVNGVRRELSNYGDTVDYNVVADSTSEAAAWFTGFISANGLDSVDDTVNQGFIYTPDYVVPDEEETVTEDFSKYTFDKEKLALVRYTYVDAEKIEEDDTIDSIFMEDDVETRLDKFYGTVVEYCEVYDAGDGTYKFKIDSPFINKQVVGGKYTDIIFAKGNDLGQSVKEGISYDPETKVVTVSSDLMEREESDFCNIQAQVLVPSDGVPTALQTIMIENADGTVYEKKIKIEGFKNQVIPLAVSGDFTDKDLEIYLNEHHLPSSFKWNEENKEIALEEYAACVYKIRIKIKKDTEVMFHSAYDNRYRNSSIHFYLKSQNALSKLTYEDSNKTRHGRSTVAVTAQLNTAIHPNYTTSTRNQSLGRSFGAKYTTGVDVFVPTDGSGNGYVQQMTKDYDNGYVGFPKNLFGLDFDFKDNSGSSLGTWNETVYAPSSWGPNWVKGAVISGYNRPFNSWCTHISANVEKGWVEEYYGYKILDWFTRSDLPGYTCFTMSYCAMGPIETEGGNQAMSGIVNFAVKNSPTKIKIKAFDSMPIISRMNNQHKNNGYSLSEGAFVVLDGNTQDATELCQFRLTAYGTTYRIDDTSSDTFTYTGSLSKLYVKMSNNPSGYSMDRTYYEIDSATGGDITLTIPLVPKMATIDASYKDPEIIKDNENYDLSSVYTAYSDEACQNPVGDIKIDGNGKSCGYVTASETKLTEERPIKDGIYEILSTANPNLRIQSEDNLSYNKANNVYLKQNDTDKINTAWRFQYYGNGYYVITNPVNNMYIAVETTNVDSVSNNTNVYEKMYLSDVAYWKISKNEDGTFSFHPKTNEQLSLSSKTTTVTDGTNVCVSENTCQWTVKVEDYVVPEGVYQIKSFKNASYGIQVESHKMLDAPNIVLKQTSYNDDTLDNGVKKLSMWYFQPVGEGYYTIQNISTGKMMNVYGGTGESGTNVFSFKRDGTKAELWKIEKNEDGSFTLHPAVNLNLSLDLSTGEVKENQNIQIFENNFTEAQKWILENHTGLPKGMYYLKQTVAPKGYEKDDEIHEVNANDDYVNLKDETYTPSGAIEEGVYIFESASKPTYSMFVSGSGCSMNSGTTVNWYLTENALINNVTFERQLFWYVLDLGDGTYNIQTMLNRQRYLDVSGGVAANGTQIQIYKKAADKDINNQRWKFVKNSDGTYSVRSMINTNFCLDFFKGSSVKGKNIQLYQYNDDAKTMRWYLRKINYPDYGAIIPRSVELETTPLMSSQVNIIQKVLEDPDVNDMISLEDAEYQVEFFGTDAYSDIPEDAVPLRTWTFKTDADGKLLYSNSSKVSGDELFADINGNSVIPFGVMRIKETKAPDGLLVGKETMIIPCNAEGASEKYNTIPIVAAAEHKEMFRRLVIKKTGGGTKQTGGGVKLEGVKFDLTMSDGSVKTLTTDASGQCVVYPLKAGTYRLKETYAPEGFEKLKDVLVFKVNADGSYERISGGVPDYVGASNAIMDLDDAGNVAVDVTDSVYSVDVNVYVKDSYNNIPLKGLNVQYRSIGVNIDSVNFSDFYAGPKSTDVNGYVHFTPDETNLFYGMKQISILNTLTGYRSIPSSKFHAMHLVPTNGSSLVALIEGSGEVKTVFNQTSKRFTINVYMKAEPIEYTVHYDANGGSGTMTDQKVKYNEVFDLKENEFAAPPVTSALEQWGYYGWDPDPTLGKRCEEAHEVLEDEFFIHKKDIPKNLKGWSNLSTKDGDVITLYAVWINEKKINSPPEITAPDKEYLEGDVVTRDDLMAGVVATDEDPHDADIQDKVIITKIEYAAGKLENGTKKPAYTEAWANGMPSDGTLDTWHLKLDKSTAPVKHKVTYSVTDAFGETATTTAIITVKYNEYPTIEADDRYFSLDEAQSGIITKDLLLDEAIEDGKLSADDKEDGDISDKLTILDLNEEEFKGFTDSGYRKLTLSVTDSRGKTSTRQITVYVIVDGRIPDVPKAKEVRFISKKYYEKNLPEGLEAAFGSGKTRDTLTEEEIAKANGNGGLNVFSKWYTEADWKALISATFDKTVPDEHYCYSYEDVQKIKEYIEVHGIGNAKEEDALSNFADEFMTGAYKIK